MVKNYTLPNKIVTSSHRGWYHSATTEEKLGNLATRDVKPKNIFPPAQENSSWYMTVCNFNLRYASVDSLRLPKLIKGYHHLPPWLVWDTCFHPQLTVNNQLFISSNFYDTIIFKDGRQKNTFQRSTRLFLEPQAVPPPSAPPSHPLPLRSV